MPFGQYLPSVGPGARRIRAPSIVSAWVMNGSGEQVASTWPEFSAARIAGNGIATNLIEFWSTLYLLSAARITISQTPLSAFPAIVFPSRSFGVLIELEPLTMTFCQLSSIEVASSSLAETATIGSPCDRAMIAGTQPMYPMSPLPFDIARTMSLPLWKVVFLISMPCFAKKPCSIPMSSANPFAIGSPSRLIVASFRCCFSAGRRPDEGEQQHCCAGEHDDHASRRTRVRVIRCTSPTWISGRLEPDALRVRARLWDLRYRNARRCPVWWNRPAASSRPARA